MFVACWLFLPTAADPIVSGAWTIDAQPVDEQDKTKASLEVHF